MNTTQSKTEHIGGDLYSCVCLKAHTLEQSDNAIETPRAFQWLLKFAPALCAGNHQPSSSDIVATTLLPHHFDLPYHGDLLMQAQLPGTLALIVMLTHRTSEPVFEEKISLRSNLIPTTVAYSQHSNTNKIQKQCPSMAGDITFSRPSGLWA
jgi:hypothetical protein